MQKSREEKINMTEWDDIIDLIKEKFNKDGWEFIHYDFERYFEIKYQGEYIYDISESISYSYGFSIKYLEIESKLNFRNYVTSSLLYKKFEELSLIEIEVHINSLKKRTERFYPIYKEFEKSLTEFHTFDIKKEMRDIKLNNLISFA